MRKDAEKRHAWFNQRLEERGQPITPFSWKPPYFFGFYDAPRELGMGNYRSYLCPAGLIGVGDVPERWGLVWYLEKDGLPTFKVKRSPTRFPDNEINHQAGMTYLLTIMKRMVGNVENWAQAAAWGSRGRFVQVEVRQ